MTFGAGGGGGVEATSGGDCARGCSESTDDSGRSREGSDGEAGDGGSTWLFGGDSTRLRGSEGKRVCGEGERGLHDCGHGVRPESPGSLSTSICNGRHESASGEEVEMIDKKEDDKVDNLGERGEELEENEAVDGDSNDKLANGVEGDGDA